MKKQITPNSYSLGYHVQFHPIIREITGTLPSAILLSKMLFWANNPSTKSRNGWFFKDHDSWTEDTSLTRGEQRGARRVLQELELVYEKSIAVKPKGSASPIKTTLYKINREKIDELVHQALLERERLDKEKQAKKTKRYFNWFDFERLIFAEIEKIPSPSDQIQKQPSNPDSSLNGSPEPIREQPANPDNSMNGSPEPIREQPSSPDNSLNGSSEPIREQPASPDNSLNGSSEPVRNGSPEPRDSLQAINDGGCSSGHINYNYIDINNNKELRCLENSQALFEKIKNSALQKFKEHYQCSDEYMIKVEFQAEDYRDYCVDKKIRPSRSGLWGYLVNGIDQQINTNQRINRISQSLDGLTVSQELKFNALTEKNELITDQIDQFNFQRWQESLVK